MTARRRRNLHLMADYGAAGMWDHDGAPLDPGKLPIGPKLRERLARWCARFHKSFETEIDLDAFAVKGRAIASAVKAELSDWSVVYSARPPPRAREISGRTVQLRESRCHEARR